MLYRCKFLKINWRNGNQENVDVGFVRYKFNASALSKLASYENCFWNPVRKSKRTTYLTILLELKTIKSLEYFLIICCKNLLNDHCVFIN